MLHKSWQTRRFPSIKAPAIPPLEGLEGVQPAEYDIIISYFIYVCHISTVDFSKTSEQTPIICSFSSIDLKNCKPAERFFPFGEEFGALLLQTDALDPSWP